jgi:capsular polysaccharide biosynthesis protein
LLNEEEIARIASEQGFEIIRAEELGLLLEELRLSK